jgi:hypothetical protein
MKTKHLVACLMPPVMWALPAWADARATASLCAASEQTFFACQTSKKKLISVCGALPGPLQYRFGTRQEVQLRYPLDAATGPAAFKFAHYVRSQVDRIEVTFSNQGHDYAVFDYNEGRRERAGVRVTTPEGKEQEVTCAKPITSRLLKLKDALPCDADNALNGGSCP